MVHVLLKPGLENFEHYFASVWDECNCVVIWTFFGIALLWDWTFVIGPQDLFQSCGHCWVFQICWHIEYSTVTASSFSSVGILSPPLALFVVMLPKAHLTSHSRMSGFMWVITASWLSGCEDLFCTVLLCILATSSYRTGKGQFSFQSQRKAMPKNAQTTTQLHSSHTLVK